MRAGKALRRAAATIAVVACVASVPAGVARADSGDLVRYTVVSADGVGVDEAVTAITAAGGTVVDRNAKVGLFMVQAPERGFAERAATSAALAGASRHAIAGRAPGARAKTDGAEVGDPTAPPDGQSAPVGDRITATATADPLDGRLWGARMIHADRAHAVNPGDRRVTVGILDTGVDATSPDIAATFDWSLSRNFAGDMPEIDGPCEVAGCLDPVGTDDNGHGTHVAGIVGAAANGVGVSGVAPGVRLVELKAGQDSGYFFLDNAVNALVYAGDNGINVVNMSWFIDPWYFNCWHNTADSPAAQAEQRAILVGMNRALAYAWSRGTTLVTAAANEHDNLNAPRTDTRSPDVPAGGTYPRPIDPDSCAVLPAGSPFAIAVSAVGPSKRKADYSNYGTRYVDLSAPGGWLLDGFGTPDFRSYGNRILSTYPKKRLQQLGAVDADGNIVPGFESRVFKDCTSEQVCGYYTYLEGTSMAAPHVAAVAALVVSRFASPDRRHDGRLAMPPWLVRATLERTATRTACPVPALQSYADEGRPAEFNALCEGSADFNGFYGHGIVDAYAAVTADMPANP